MKINYTAAAMAALTAGALLLFFRKGMKDASKTPSGSAERGRGYRNNNPLNIRVSNNNWQGKVPYEQNTDSGKTFEQFTSMAYGFRAAMVNIRTYIERYGWRTVEAVISHWAPANENHTSKYITDVCKITGMQPNTVISTVSQQQMCALVRAMAYIENGYYVTGIDNYIQQAWNLYKQA